MDKIIELQNEIARMKIDLHLERKGKERWKKDAIEQTKQNKRLRTAAHSLLHLSDNFWMQSVDHTHVHQCITCGVLSEDRWDDNHAADCPIEKLLTALHEDYKEEPDGR